MENEKAPRRRVNPIKAILSKFNIYQEGKLDPTFLILVLVLMTIGLICLFSSSYAFALQNYGSSFHFIKRQLVFAVVGIAIMFALSYVDCNFYKKFAWIIYFASVAMLIIVHQLAYRRTRVWSDFYQIQLLFLCKCKCLSGGHNAKLLAFLIDHANFPIADLFIDHQIVDKTHLLFPSAE